MKKFICLFFVILLSISLLGCKKDETVTNRINIKVNDIVISKTHAYVDVGNTVILTAQVYPFNADNQKIKWKSDNNDIAEVNSGIVLGKGEGRTVITCLSEDGEKEDKCILYVSSPKLNYDNYTNNLTNVNLINPKNVGKKVLLNENKTNFVEEYFAKIDELNKKFIELENDFIKNMFDEKDFDQTKIENYDNINKNENKIIDNVNEENIINVGDNKENQPGLNLSDENEKHIYFYSYKYNSNGINDKSDEYTTYKDDNTIIKEYYN